MHVCSPGPIRPSLPEPCVIFKLAQISEASINKNTTAYKENLSIIFKPLAISQITRSTMIMSKIDSCLSLCHVAKGLTEGGYE